MWTQTLETWIIPTNILDFLFLYLLWFIDFLTLELFGFLCSLLLFTFWISVVNNGDWYSIFIYWKVQLQCQGPEIIFYPVYQAGDSDLHNHHSLPYFAHNFIQILLTKHSNFPYAGPTFPKRLFDSYSGMSAQHV